MARPDNLILGIENALDGATVRKDYLTATPSQQTGYAATQSLDEALGLPYRAAAADAEYTPVLYRLEEPREVGAFAALAHNMTATGSWRMTVAEEGGLAVRPVWITDGAADTATTASMTVPQAADFTLLLRAILPPPSFATEASVCAIVQITDAVGERLRLAYRRASDSSPLRLYVRLVHNAVNVANVISDGSFVPRGLWADVAVRYRDSDRHISIWTDGVEVATGTASAAWTDNGAEAFFVGSTGGALFTPGSFQSIAYFGAYLTDAQVAAYRHQVPSGLERNLSASWSFLEGSGTSVANDVSGGPALTLTGGDWAQKANGKETSTPVYDAVGQWVRRDALRLKEAVEVTSPAFGAAPSSNAPRDITLACIVRVDDDHATTTSATGRNVAAYGASLANAEILIGVDDGELVVASARGGLGEVNLGAIDDGVARRVRAVLYAIDSTSSTLDVYVAAGDTPETLAGTTNVGPHDNLATCKLFLGAPSSNAHCIVSEIRIWASRRFESDDGGSLVDPPDLSEITILEALRLDGEVVSDVDSTRSYTVTGATYETLENPRVTRPSAARDGLGSPRTGGTQDQIARLQEVLLADVVADEIFLELWDRNQTAGIELGAVLAWSTWRPTTHRVFGAPRSHARPSLKRSISGSPHLEVGYSSDIVAVTLGYVDNDFAAKSETDDLIARIGRRRQDRLALIAFDPGVPQYLLTDRSVVGVIESIRGVEDTDNYYSKTEISISGVL